MVVDAHVSMNVKLPAMLIGVLNWVVLPAVALLLGSLPVLHRSDTAAARV
jgi:metallophosphoesterase superfamily enzyme